METACYAVRLHKTLVSAKGVIISLCQCVFCYTVDEKEGYSEMSQQFSEPKVKTPSEFSEDDVEHERLEMDVL